MSTVGSATSGFTSAGSMHTSIQISVPPPQVVESFKDAQLQAAVARVQAILYARAHSEVPPTVQQIGGGLFNVLIWQRERSTPPDFFGGQEVKETTMNMSMGMGSTGLQASAAVYGIAAPLKTPPDARDDVVHAIGGESSNGQAAKSDLSLLKMSNPTVGQAVDVQA
jgi:hypothetical protein